jgi:hypothetical protein
LPAGGEWLAGALRGTVSPYQSNPLGLNPLRDLLDERSTSTPSRTAD